MGFFDFTRKHLVGIDIGTSSIKLVELMKKGGRFELTNYGMFELKSGDESVNLASEAQKQKLAHLTDDDIAWGIKEVLKQAGIKTKEVAASIPSFPTFATTISMPFSSKEEIAKSIKFEARKYIPVPIEEVQLDWSIIDSSDSSAPSVSTDDSKDGAPKVDVFVVAVPKDHIERYKNIAANVGLKLRALELESFALIRTLIGNDLSPMCVINIGGRSTSILIVDKGYQRAINDYEVGGFQVTRSIASSLNISLARAEELKRSYGVRNQDDNVIKEAVSSLIDMMVFETKKTIQNYEELKKRKISQVMLVGGLTNMPDLDKYFSDKMGRAVTLGNSLSRVIIKPELEPIRSELNASFAVAIGLAMRG